MEKKMDKKEKRKRDEREISNFMQSKTKQSKAKLVSHVKHIDWSNKDHVKV